MRLLLSVFSLLRFPFLSFFLSSLLCFSFVWKWRFPELVFSLSIRIEPSNPINPLASFSPGISFPLSKPKKSLNIDAFRAPIEDPSEKAEKMKEALELAKKLKSKYKNKKKKKTEEDEPKEKEMDGENVEENREDGPVEAEKVSFLAVFFFW